jgi:hypothetical protein
MAPLLLNGIFSLGSTLIDKLFPDPTEKARAELALLSLHQAGELKIMETSLSAILAEAQSPDPWTSRARPSFLYVVYVLLLGAIPMGVLTVFSPSSAAAFTAGFQAWLYAIPDPILTLFGTVMLGYGAGRTLEKIKGVAK